MELDKDLFDANIDSPIKRPIYGTVQSSKGLVTFNKVGSVTWV